MASVQKYGSQKRLMENQRYTVNFELRGESKTYSFTSRYAPLYSSVRIIRSDWPELLEHISDDTINLQIWDTSITVDGIVETLQNTGGLGNMSDEQVGFAKKQYVRYKTEYTLIRNILLSSAAQGGSQEKSLGEFKISKQIDIDLDGILSKLKEDVRTWEAQLNIQARVLGATRAGRNFPFPLNGRVSF